jgi:peroxiredoxin
MKTIYFLLLLTPMRANSQAIIGFSYDEGKDNCKRIVEENQKLNPDKLVYTGPECMIGARVPNFTAETFDGKVITSDYFNGKITILNFWQISCPPCIAEIPGLNEVVNKFGHENFNFLAISPDDEKDILPFLAKHPWNYSQLSSGKLVLFDVFKHGWGFPTTFVFNKNGIIIAAFSGGRSDERAVKEIEDKLSSIIMAELK